MDTFGLAVSFIGMFIFISGRFFPEESSSKKKMLLCGALCIFGGMFIGVGGGPSKDAPNGVPIMVALGFICLVIGILVLILKNKTIIMWTSISALVIAGLFTFFTVCSSPSKNSSFTNKYGTKTTKCAHPGCDDYIARSGDTNCCTSHSNKCEECGDYIDEDAFWCMDCIESALK